MIETAHQGESLLDYDQISTGRARGGLLVFILIAFGVPWAGWVVFRLTPSPGATLESLSMFWLPAAVSLAGFAAACVEGGLPALHVFARRVFNLHFNPWLWILATLLPLIAAVLTFINHPADLLTEGSALVAVTPTAHIRQPVDRAARRRIRLAWLSVAAILPAGFAAYCRFGYRSDLGTVARTAFLRQRVRALEFGDRICRMGDCLVGDYVPGRGALSRQRSSFDPDSLSDQYSSVIFCCATVGIAA